jgi:hypothetical protein
MPDAHELPTSSSTSDFWARRTAAEGSVGFRSRGGAGRITEDDAGGGDDDDDDAAVESLAAAAAAARWWWCCCTTDMTTSAAMMRFSSTGDPFRKVASLR